jgi:MFS family permease
MTKANPSPSWLGRVTLGSRDFGTYWLGQSLSNLGSAFTQFALPLLVFKLTGSAVSLALAFAAYELPYLLFGIVIGAYVDRLDRKRLMIGTDLARAALLAGVPLLALLHLLSVNWIYLAAFLISTLSFAFNTAEFAAIPSMVPESTLVAANGRIQATYNAMAVIGPVLAGVLVLLLPLPALLLVDAASFLISALTLGQIRISFNQEQPEETVSLGASIREGVRYVFGHPVLRSISIMMAVVNFLAVTSFAQLVLFAKTRLAASDPQVAWLFAAGGVGAVIFALLAGRLRQHWPYSVVALGAIIADGLATASLALMHWYLLALMAWAVVSGLGVLFNVAFTSLWQAIVPNRLLGRVLSVATVMAWAANPLGSIIGGYAIAQTHNIALVYGVSGLGVAVVAFAFIWSPIGRAERYLLAAAPPPDPLPNRDGEGETSRVITA